MTSASTPAPVSASIDYDSLKHLLAGRPREAHKGDFGHVLVVGGARGLGGAALMAAEAALRTGAGLVSAATHPSHVSAFLARRPEIMARGLEQDLDLRALLDQATAVVAGPGLGRSDWSRAQLHMTLEVCRQRRLPLVLDADALNLIADGVFRDTGETLSQAILTPHPGEAARLLRLSSTVVQSDREAAALELQARFGGVVVLKGAGTLVCHEKDGSRHLARCTQGNPGMASGGMGDVLSGVLGALLAQQHPLPEAAMLGVCLHAASGDHAADDGERGMLACDLLPWLRRLANP